MKTYYTITVTNPNGEHIKYPLNDKDIVEKVEGGMQITFHSSPSITTFFPYHRIWEAEEIDTSEMADDTIDEGSFSYDL